MKKHKVGDIDDGFRALGIKDNDNSPELGIE
jgi:hypothetical protein